MCYDEIMATDFTDVRDDNYVIVNQLVADKPFLAEVGDVKGKRLLDVGCGSGRYARWFAAAGADVTAVDRNPANIEEAQRRGSSGIAYRCADAANVTDEKGFDIAVAVFMLNELPPEAFAPVLQNVGALLRPGGRLISVIPHPFFLFDEQTDVVRRSGISQKDYTNVGFAYDVQLALSGGTWLSVRDHHYPLEYIISELANAGLCVGAFKELLAPTGTNAAYEKTPYQALITALKPAAKE